MLQLEYLAGWLWVSSIGYVVVRTIKSVRHFHQSSTDGCLRDYWCSWPKPDSELLPTSVWEILATMQSQLDEWNFEIGALRCITQYKNQSEASALFPEIKNRLYHIENVINVFNVFEYLSRFIHFSFSKERNQRTEWNKKQKRRITENIGNETIEDQQLGIQLTPLAFRKDTFWLLFWIAVREFDFWSSLAETKETNNFILVLCRVTVKKIYFLFWGRAAGWVVDIVLI